MRLLKTFVARFMLTGAALFMAVLLLPVFLVTEQVDEFSRLVEAIFRDRKG